MKAHVSSLTERIHAVRESEDRAFERFMAAANSGPLVKTPGNVVIYIEDDPDHVSLFKTIVSQYSTMNVIPAFTVEDGKKLIQKKNGRIKCIVMDMDFSMGMGDGLDLLSWIKDRYPDVPVLVLTGHLEAAPEVYKRFPTVEVHIKASDSVENLVRSIELVSLGV